jgi:hypothetical protein
MGAKDPLRGARIIGVVLLLTLLAVVIVAFRL